MFQSSLKKFDLGTWIRFGVLGLFLVGIFGYGGIAEDMKESFSHGMLVGTEGDIQAVHSDYGGYWFAEVSTYNSNPVIPDLFHNLLAFEIGGVTYSTAVDDAELDTQGVAYMPGSYQAFVPIEAESDKVGQAALEDGEVGTAQTVLPVSGMDVIPYITQGVQGLGLGSFGNNIGAEFLFGVSNLGSSVIGDGQPDIVYFNGAGAGSDLIEFIFLDASNNQVGDIVQVEENRPNIGKIANDRINIVSGNPTAVNSTQPLEGFGFDLDAFALDTTQLASIMSLKVILPSPADPTFIAYNTDAFSVSACGNGVVEDPEECDDANENEEDECSSTCEIILCDEGSERIGGICTECGKEDQVECAAGCEDNLIAQGGICVVCGGEGEPECSDGCEEGLIGQGGICVLCGGLGQDACDIGCLPGLVDQGGTCVACGEDGQPECNEGCEEGTVSINGVCMTCGALDEPVCQFAMCEAGLVGLEGVCVLCGEEGQQECTDGCEEGTVAVNSVCASCGALNQPVCEGGNCDLGLSGDAGMCELCGSLGEIICENGNLCDDTDGQCNGSGCEDALVKNEAGYCANPPKKKFVPDEEEEEESIDELPLLYLSIQMEGVAQCEGSFVGSVFINDKKYLDFVELWFDGPISKTTRVDVSDDGSFTFDFDAGYLADGAYTVFYTARNTLNTTDTGSGEIVIDCENNSDIEELNNGNETEVGTTALPPPSGDSIDALIEEDVDEVFDSAPEIEEEEGNVGTQDFASSLGDITQPTETVGTTALPRPTRGEEENQEQEKEIQEPENLDPDGDGLENFDEYRFGSDINTYDTDGDGLNDYEEVMIYNTDPLNPDTDGGGITDGLEIIKGSNPLGRRDDTFSDEVEELKIELQTQLLDKAFRADDSQVDSVDTSGSMGSAESASPSGTINTESTSGSSDSPLANSKTLGNADTNNSKSSGRMLSDNELGALGFTNEDEKGGAGDLGSTNNSGASNAVLANLAIGNSGIFNSASTTDPVDQDFGWIPDLLPNTGAKLD